MAPAGGAVLVLLAVGQGADLLGGLGEDGGGGGEFPLVHEVHRHRLAEHEHGFGAALPCEVRVGRAAVVACERGEVVAVGIAVALREHALRIGGIDRRRRRCCCRPSP